VATEKEFPDLPAVIEAARGNATMAGDPHARVDIVKSTIALMYDHSTSSDPERNRLVYVVRLEGTFTGCPACRGPAGYTHPPTQWMSFDWDPERHVGPDFSYGSAPHLEELGTVYRVQIE
jgi:hypothetical protein